VGSSEVSTLAAPATSQPAAPPAPGAPKKNVGYL
jgi:hypothetical protein